MTMFDVLVLAIIAIGAIGGFLRGFVQEALSLASWLLAVFAIRFLHTPVTLALLDVFGNATMAALLALSLLLLIPYAAMKLISGRLGGGSGASLLGPVDRVLGFGFGAVKGVIIGVIAFSLLVIGYDNVWGPAGRPAWIATARTYPLMNAASNQLVELIAERRRADNAAGNDADPAEPEG